MSSNLFNYLSAILPPLFATIIGVARFSRFSISLRYMFFFVVLGAFVEVANTTLSVSDIVKNNMPLGNIYFILSFLLLGLYFMHLFKGYISRKVFIILIVCYELFFLINLFFVQTIFQYPAVPKAISDIVFLVFSVLFFYKTMIEAKIEKLWDEPLIYANLAILLFYSGILFYSLLFNIILDNAIEFATFAQKYLFCLNAIFYLFIAIGFWKAGKQKQLNDAL